MSLDTKKRQKISHVHTPTSPSVYTSLPTLDTLGASDFDSWNNTTLDSQTQFMSDSTANVCAAYGIMTEELTIPSPLPDLGVGNGDWNTPPISADLLDMHTFDSTSHVNPAPFVAATPQSFSSNPYQTQPVPTASALLLNNNAAVLQNPAMAAHIGGVNPRAQSPGSGNHSDSDSSSDGSRGARKRSNSGDGGENFKVGMKRRQPRKPRTPVDPNEPPEAKKERNKKSAADYRARRKNYVSDLEGRVEDLSGTVSSQKQQITSLGTENSMLKQQLAYLKNLLSLTQVRNKVNAVSAQATHTFNSMAPLQQSSLVLFSIFTVLLVASPMGFNPAYDARIPLYGRELAHAHCGGGSAAGRVLLGVNGERDKDHEIEDDTTSLLHQWTSRAECDTQTDCQANATSFSAHTEQQSQASHSPAAVTAGRVWSDFTHLPVLMEDAYVRLTPLSLIVKNYYLPLGVKVIPLDTIHSVKLRSLPNDYKYWGYGFADGTHTWWARDYARAAQTQYLQIETDSWLNVAVTTSDSQHAFNLLQQVGYGKSVPSYTVASMAASASAA